MPNTSLSHTHGGLCRKIVFSFPNTHVNLHSNSVQSVCVCGEGFICPLKLAKFDKTLPKSIIQHNDVH